MRKYDTAADACIGEFNHIWEHGESVKPRGLETREVLANQFVVFHPDHLSRLTNRGLNMDIGRLEILSLVGQTPADSQQRSTPLGRFHDDGIQLGNYGARIRGQLQAIVDELHYDKDSRKAVLSIYDSARDLGSSTTDLPCTTTLQFLIRGGVLCLVATMRSSDAVLGLPYDLMQFGAIQAAVAGDLGLPVGPLWLQAGSAHVYESSASKMEGVTDAEFICKVEFSGPVSESAQFCQDVLAGRPVGSRNEFERWLGRYNQHRGEK